MLALGLGVMILIGSGLLCLPWANPDQQWGNALDALFTATSATCVTGLTVYNISEDFTLFGQVVTLGLIQLGGLGFMAMTTLMAVVLKRKITLRDRLMIQAQFGLESLRGMVRWIRYVVVFSLLMEGIGALVLASQWVPLYGWKKGLWLAIFHAISAFCNAGFDLFGDSMVGFQSEPVVLFCISLLIISGGLGFAVHSDVLSGKRQKTLHSKLVVITTGLLLILGTVAFFLLERSNQGTLAGLSLVDQFSNAFFQSATSRTAGFFSLDQNAMTEVGVLGTIALMFVGGSPGSTAGGLKTTTLAVLVLSTVQQLRGREELVVFHRRISKETILRATTIMVLSVCWVTTVAVILSLWERIPFLPALYESVSAFATVGLTMNLTPDLENPSKILVMLSMYAGRLGPVTLAYALFQDKKDITTKSANGKVMIG